MCRRTTRREGVKENGDKYEGGLMSSVSGSATTSNIGVFTHRDTLYQNTSNEKYNISRKGLAMTGYA